MKLLNQLVHETESDVANEGKFHRKQNQPEKNNSFPMKFKKSCVINFEF